MAKRIEAKDVGNRKAITATFEIVTPMFLGGADHEVSRIRESSIKGALAFWWRALNYGRFVDDAKGDQCRALEAMQTEERELFGGGESGQGAFLLRVKNADLCTVDKETLLHDVESKVVGPGARYMAGQGLIEAFDGKKTKAGKLIRSCIKEGGSFNLEFVFLKSKQELIVEKLLPALRVFGLLGGLGSRVRRGWGSVSLIELKSEDIEISDGKPIGSLDVYSQRINELVPKNSRSGSGLDWPVSAFAKESRVWVSDHPSAKQPRWTNPLEALDMLGRAFLNYRAWGKNGKAGDQPVQKQFLEDHNWFYGTNPKVDVPYRVAFGLPHNYFKFVNNDRNWVGEVNVGNEGRRASPMFFHVHKLGDKYFGVIVILPTKFHEEEITAKPAKGPYTKRKYSLSDEYGKKKSASGIDVLLDFGGKGSGKFTENQVLSFEDVLN